MTGLELAIFIISPILSFGIAIFCSPREMEFKNEYSSSLLHQEFRKTNSYQLYADERNDKQLVRKQF